MKFNRLVDNFDKLVSKHEQGKKIKSEKLVKLQQMLVAKKSRYEVKLQASMEPGKRKKLGARLKVVVAQIEKSKKLPSG